MRAHLQLGLLRGGEAGDVRQEAALLLLPALCRAQRRTQLFDLPRMRLLLHASISCRRLMALRITRPKFCILACTDA